MIPFLQTALPPSNLSFLIAAFVVTGVSFLGYVFFIFRRRQETHSEINRLLGTSRMNESAGTDDT